jgi:L-malate glycosyltransferase
MKILIIAGGYPSIHYPMNGIFEFDQAKAIADMGNKVIFASVDLRSIRRKRRWGFEKFEKEGVLIYGINIPLGRVPKRMLTFFSKVGLKLLYNKIENEQGRPDIMHAHFTDIGYSAAKLKDKTKIPLVITEHSSGMMADSISDDIKWKVSKTYHKADKLITVSPALKRVIKYNFNIDSTYIPNMVDTNIFKYISNGNKNNEFTFITIGNLIFRKRMDLTVQAFSNAFKNKDNVKLIVIGEGIERKQIEDLIKKEDLQNKIILKGRLPRNEIAKYLEESDCFVLASRAETFGVVYIEALAAGIPVIGTRCGGPEEFIKDGDGLLIGIDNIDELSDAMKYMYDNIGFFNKQEISDRAYNQFSPEQIAEKITQVYKDII